MSTSNQSHSSNQAPSQEPVASNPTSNQAPSQEPVASNATSASKKKKKKGRRVGAVAWKSPETEQLLHIVEKLLPAGSK